ncbi:MAG: hypothetical protein K1X79_10110 [Oligoflexia bacterium]|nr:hypothetical protein [Oligoflexia bacterium]
MNIKQLDHINAKPSQDSPTETHPINAPATDVPEVGAERMAPVLDFYAARTRLLAAELQGEMRLAAGAEGINRMPSLGGGSGLAVSASRLGGISPGDGYYPSSHDRFMDDLAARRVPIVVGVYGPGPDPGGRGEEVVASLAAGAHRLTEEDHRMLATFAAGCLREFSEGWGDSPRTEDKVRRAIEMIQPVRVTGYALGKAIGVDTPVKSIEFSKEAISPGRDGTVKVLFGFQ